MSHGLTKVHENANRVNTVCHPELVSGSQTMPGKEVLKQVQNDTDGSSV